MSNDGKKALFILRGLPGSGKSHLARKLAASLRGPIRIVSADFFFEQLDGSYKFNKNLERRAHIECVTSFLDGLASGFQKIIVDNTNSQKWEYTNFEVLAQAYGYSVSILEIHCPNQKQAVAFHARNTHAVPLSTHGNMFLNWENDPRAKLIKAWFPDGGEKTKSRDSNVMPGMDRPRSSEYGDRHSSRVTSRRGPGLDRPRSSELHVRTTGVRPGMDRARSSGYDSTFRGLSPSSRTFSSRNQLYDQATYGSPSYGPSEISSDVEDDWEMNITRNVSNLLRSAQLTTKDDAHDEDCAPDAKLIVVLNEETQPDHALVQTPVL